MKQKQGPLVVVRGMLVRDDTVLFLKRALHKQYPNAWTFPGGKVDFGESLERAIRRETWEETGLRPREITHLAMHEYLPTPSQPRHVIAFYYQVQTYRGSEVIINDESSEYAWVTRTQLKRLSLALRHRPFLFSLFDRIVPSRA